MRRRPLLFIDSHQSRVFTITLTAPMQLTCSAIRVALGLSLAVAVQAAPQGPPAGYYNTVDDSNPATLRSSLHAVIDDHTRLSYTSGGIDTWFVLERAQQDPSNSSNILDVYKGASYTKNSNSYNREHTWPKSYGFPNDGSANSPYTDCHMLRLCDSSYNSSRSNKPFRYCSSSCAEYPTNGGTSGSYPGTSNWSTGSFSNGTWEVQMNRRGDVARGMLYADVRYEGGNHGTTGFLEPDLILTNNTSLIANSNTGQNLSVAYMGLLDVLLDWHLADPVDAFEENRNDEVFSFQGNRNPFVDHPEWVDCIFNGNCGSGGFGVTYCTPNVPNSTGLSGAIQGQGSLDIVLNDLELIVTQMPTNQFGYFLVSQTEGLTFSPGGSQGILCLGGQIGRFTSQIQGTGIFGTFAIIVDLTNLPIGGGTAALAGDTWSFQCWYRDANPGPTSNFTDGLRLTFQ
ncbi:MAG: endonuclease I [Planctomycetota bacterium]